MKILVTGASGRIGERLVDWLETNTQDDLILTSRRKPNFDGRRSIWVGGDLRNQDTLHKIFSYHPDIIIHLAAAVGQKNSSSIINYEDIELMPTLSLIDYILSNQYSVKFIFASSGGTVYKDSLNPHFETDQVQCSSLYSCNKIYIEHLLWLYREALHPVILRISNPYGMKINPDINQGIVDIAVNCAKLNKLFNVWGDINNIRDFIYIDDVCSAFTRSIQYSGSMYEIFNIGSGVGISILKIMDLISDYCPKFKYDVNSKKHINDIACNVLNISKAQKMLQWRPTVSVENYLGLILG